MKKISEIINENGYPQLCINGEIQDGLAYITYLTDNNHYIDFAKAGYRLFSVPVFFGSNHLNEHSGLNVFKKGIFDKDVEDDPPGRELLPDEVDYLTADQENDAR